MMDALLVSNAVLWLLVIVLAGVVLALVRQVGILYERVAPAGALAVQGGPKVGERAPELVVETWSGDSLHLGGASADGRSTLLFFASPSCPVCKSLLPVLASVEASERAWLRAVVASDGPRAEHERFVAQHGLARGDYVLSTALGLAYQVAKLPHAVLIDETGVVRAAGLVNTREHLESLFEAKERGVASVQEYVAREGGDDGRRVA
jgi:methylamine dehydrogenase accessory protein MauD